MIMSRAGLDNCLLASGFCKTNTCVKRSIPKGRTSGIRASVETLNKRTFNSGRVCRQRKREEKQGDYLAYGPTEDLLVSSIYADAKEDGDAIKSRLSWKMMNPRNAEVYLESNSLKDSLYPTQKGFTKDYRQIDEYVLEEMGLEIVASSMISMRMKKFYKRLGRKLQFDDNRTCCRLGQIIQKMKDNALMALQTVSAQTQSDASIEIKAYSQGLKKVESQLVAHQQGQLWYEQKIKFMKIDLDDKTDVLTYHKKLLAEAQKEKEELKGS
ncbi:hypothetical protein Tco_1164937 [Tanacetum coccineum]